MGGDVMRVDLNDTSLALDIKHAVARHWEIPPTCQRLILGSNVLQDADAIGTLCAHDGPTSLTMAISLDGIYSCVSGGSNPEKMHALEDVMKLGPRGGVAAVRAVIGALHQQDECVQRKAQKALDYLASTLRDDPLAMEVICGMLAEEEYQSAGVQTLAAAGTTGNHAVVAALCTLIKSSWNSDVLVDAVCALASAAERGDLEAIAALCDCLENPDVNVRLYAAKYLATVTDKGNRSVALVLIQCLLDVDEDVSRAAVTTLKSTAGQGNMEIVALLSDCIKNGHGSIHGRAAMQALAHVSERGDAVVVSLISAHLADTHADVRYSALRALAVVASVSDPVSIDGITRCLQDADADVRHTAVKALHRIAEANNTVAVAALKTCLCDSNDLVRCAARDTLVRLTGITTFDHEQARIIPANTTPSGFWDPSLHLEPLRHWWSEIRDIFPRCSNVAVAVT